jgi:hypothetical protein
MNVAINLVRTVFRAFHTDEECAAIEPLLREPYYLYDDHATRGTLSDALGGIAALKVRRVLHDLQQQSLVHIAEVNHKEYFYIDFIHFIKLVRLRFARFAEAVKAVSLATVVETQLLYECPKCRKGYTMLDVSARFDFGVGAFTCDRDGTPLRESAHAASAMQVGEHQKHSKQLREKFDEQTARVLGQREGIVELLGQADGLAANIPENHPKLRLHREEVAEQEAQAAAEGRLAHHSDDETQVRAVAAVREANAELVPWLARSSVTNLETEAAIESRREAEAKRRRLGDDDDDAQQDDDEYVSKYRASLSQGAAAQALVGASDAHPDAQPAPPNVQAKEPSAERPSKMFTYNGKTVPVDAVPEEDLATMDGEDYAAYFKLLNNEDEEGEGD